MSRRTPTAKVTAGGAAAAAVTVAVWAANTLGLDIPAEVAAAAVTLISITAAYLIPEQAPQGRHRDTT